MLKFRIRQHKVSHWIPAKNMWGFGFPGAMFTHFTHRRIIDIFVRWKEIPD